MRVKVFFPKKDGEEGRVIYIASDFNIDNGILTIYSEKSSSVVLAAYAPGFWSTVENADEIYNQHKENRL